MGAFLTASDSLAAIATDARDFLETIWPEWQLESHRKFGVSAPRIMSHSTCGRSSTFVQKVLDEFGVAAEVRHGWFQAEASGDPFNPGTRHAWVSSGSWLIDVTADQFGAAEIIVTDQSDGRYRPDADVASPEFQLRRVQAVSEIWDRWLRSPMREKLIANLGR